MAAPSSLTAPAPLLSAPPSDVRPLPTQAAGCTTVTGDVMFIGQAADQFELFTGLPPPVEIMQAKLTELLTAGH